MNMRFEVNETASGIVAPPKDICKVKGCTNRRFKSKRPYAFCKQHSGWKNQMSRTKFTELASNTELVIIPEKTSKNKGLTSKAKKWRALRKELLTN